MRSAAEGEELSAVVPLSQNWIGEVEPDRAERRIPDDTGANRHPYRRIVHVLQAALTDNGAAGRCAGGGIEGWNLSVDFASGRVRRFALISPDRASIHEYRTTEARVLRQEVERILEFKARAPVVGAAERVIRRTGRNIARTNTSGSKSADQIGTP